MPACGREVEFATGGLRVAKFQWILSSGELEGFKFDSVPKACSG
jgi:hypothetical protein